ncbi:MAG: TetR/AcrR family transcriptional regulator [Pseudomonadota bacterium]
MARTQAADYDQKRETITAQAAALFAEKGFAGASISDLAERCSVSKSLIYHYYASKEAILFDVMTSHIDDLLSAVETTTETNAAPDENLRELSRTLLQHYVGASEHQKVLLYELGSLPDEMRKEIVRKQRIIINTAETALAALDPALAGDKAALRAKAMLFFGMLNWTNTWFKARGPISRDALAELAAETMIKSTP